LPRRCNFSRKLIIVSAGFNSPGDEMGVRPFSFPFCRFQTTEGNLGPRRRRGPECCSSRPCATVNVPAIPRPIKPATTKPGSGYHSAQCGYSISREKLLYRAVSVRGVFFASHGAGSDISGGYVPTVQKSNANCFTGTARDLNAVQPAGESKKKESKWPAKTAAGYEPRDFVSVSA